MHSQKSILEKSLALLILVLVVALALPAFGAREDDADRKSKNGKASGTIDGVSVTLEYGRPKVKDREIFGGLVPFGKIWRTGADEATTITLGADAKIEGKALSAGTYSLFTIPGEKEWTVIFNKVAEQWGAYNYESKQDALRITVQPKKADHTEELTFAVGDGHVALHWAGLAVPFTVAGH